MVILAENKLSVSQNITSNDLAFSCPTIYTEMNSQCYFVRRHLQQCLTQRWSFANGDAMVDDNC